MARVLVLCRSESASSGSTLMESLALGARLANDLEGELVAGVFGAETSAAVATMAGSGPVRAYELADPRLGQYTGDLALAAAQKLVEVAGADIVLIASDADSVEWAPRLAARLKAGVITACDAVREIGRAHV